MTNDPNSGMIMEAQDARILELQSTCDALGLGLIAALGLLPPSLLNSPQFAENNKTAMDTIKHALAIYKKAKRM